MKVSRVSYRERDKWGVGKTKTLKNTETGLSLGLGTGLSLGLGTGLSLGLGTGLSLGLGTGLSLGYGTTFQKKLALKLKNFAKRWCDIYQLCRRQSKVFNFADFAI